MTSREFNFIMEKIRSFFLITGAMDGDFSLENIRHESQDFIDFVLETTCSTFELAKYQADHPNNESNSHNNQPEKNESINSVL